MTGSLYFATLMLAAGIGIPVMAAMNARLGIALGSSSTAVIILLAVAAMVMVVTLLINGFPNLTTPDISIYYYFAGILFVFYILSITWVVPKFGVGNAVFFVLLGQLIAAAAIDHFGLFGTMPSPIDTSRLIGLILMGFGVFLSVKRISL